MKANSPSINATSSPVKATSAEFSPSDSPTAIQPEKESIQEEMVYPNGGDNEDKINEAVEVEGGDNDDKIASSCCLITGALLEKMCRSLGHQKPKCSKLFLPAKRIKGSLGWTVPRMVLVLIVLGLLDTPLTLVTVL
ncbi:hypothetical protein Tco_0869522, partial [Tanacetum coccineum]